MPLEELLVLCNDNMVGALRGIHGPMPQTDRCHGKSSGKTHVIEIVGPFLLVLEERNGFMPHG